MATRDTELAFVFPGQGCQFVGMGRDVCERFPEAREVYQRADEVLGFPLSAQCSDGPEEALNDTANTQPAIYATTLALWSALAPRLGSLRSRVAYVAGHSLGEFSALAVAGALTFEDGLRLVRRRGEAMRDAGDLAPGGMAAIIGLSDKAVADLVAEANDGEEAIWMANYNSLGQVVIAGKKHALQRAVDLAKERGAKRALPLAVSVACHTPLMKAASERLAAALEETTFHRPWTPVVSNATATALEDPDDIKAALLSQLSSPVRWVESVQLMIGKGVKRIIEVGPRAVVSGLIKRIDRSIARIDLTDAESIGAFSEEAFA